MKKYIAVFIMLFLPVLVLPAAAPEEAWVKYGLKFSLQKQYEKAVIAFEKALYINPYNGMTFEYQGDAYIGLNDRKSALDYYRMAYELKPTEELRLLTEDLADKIYGLGGFRFYPLTFDVFIHLNFPSAIGTGGHFSFNLNLGGGALVSYNFNSWFALKTGLLFVREAGNFSDLYYNTSIYEAYFIDVPVAAKFKFRFPWASSTSAPLQGVSIGGYLGAKTSSRYIDYNGLSAGETAGMDFGLYGGYDTYYIFENFGLFTSIMALYSGVEKVPGSNTRVLNLIAAAGVAF